MVIPDTTEGSNWTVAVFRCPRKNWTEVLSSFFSELDKQKASFLPHYTIRSFEPKADYFMISFRILRKQEDEKAIKSLIEEFMKGYAYEIDPSTESFFSVFHKWIRHGERGAHWTEERCQILSKTSRFALEVINSNTSMEDRLEWTHVFSNMIAIFDYEKSYHSPETYPSIRLLKYHHS